MTILEQQGAAAKQAARKLAIAGTAKKNEALEAIARVVCHPQLKGLPMELETPNDLAGYAREIALLRAQENG